MITTPGGAFAVTPDDQMWQAGNSVVQLLVFPSEKNTAPSKTLNDKPALCYINNSFKPFAEGQPQEQVLIGELNGVFTQIKIVEEQVFVVMTDKRLS